MCKSARTAKARKSACDEQNKEAIKRESVRGVTTSDETISDSCELSTMAQKCVIVTSYTK